MFTATSDTDRPELEDIIPRSPGDPATGREPTEATPESAEATPALKVYSVDDIRKVVPLGRTSIYDAIASGALRTFKVGRRRFATVDAVDDWIARMEAEGA